jgi:cell division protein FtsA
MKRRGTVAAIDVGSSKVTVLVAEAGERGGVRIIGAGVAPAEGLARGVVDHIEHARDSVSLAVEKAEQSSGMRILTAVVGIAGTHISSQNNRGIVAVSDPRRIVTADDRARVLEAAGNIAVPSSRQVLHVIPRGYWIDGSDPVSDPVGMHGSRLDAETHIVTGAVSAIQNLVKVVEGAGVAVEDLVVEQFAAATCVLHEEEQSQGVVVADIGDATTSLAVFDEGAIAHTACLPLGGYHLTQDLTQVLRCPWDAAEEAKIRQGAAFALHDDGGRQVEIATFGTSGKRQVPLHYLREIIQARVEEILEAVEIELKKAGYLDRVSAGLVLTGGTSQLPGIAEFAEARLGLPARVGVPRGYSGLSDVVGTPAYAAAIGLAEYGLQGRERPSELVRAGFDVADNGFLRRILAFGRSLMPQ